MCSYCGCQDSVFIIANFTSEHEAIINALGDVKRAVASKQISKIRVGTQALRALLEPHTLSEERSLFSELKKLDEFRKSVEDLCEEHVKIANLIDHVDDQIEGSFEILQRVLYRHIDKEENGLFPASIMALDSSAWDRAIEAAKY